MRAFGDGFDLYAATGDMTAGYWDSGTAACMNIVSGRFAGSRAIMNTNTLGVFFSKASGSNDAIHHIVVAFNQVSALGAANQTIWCQIQDGASVQCTITFRGDGVILLQSGGVGGATLATYSSAFVSNVWTAFEFEVVINNTAGSFTVRTNGSTTNSFQATGLNTRAGSANNYANQIVVGNNTQNVNTQQAIDDLLWRSDPTSVPWVGDIRCYTRMPASDVQAEFSKSPASTTQTLNSGGSVYSIAAGQARYTAYTPTSSGAVSSVILTLNVGQSGNMKCAIFASSGGAPAAVLGSATPIASPASGNNTFTFTTPVSVTGGVQYWIGFDADTSGTGFFQWGGSPTGWSSNTAYASFPAANPVTTSGNPAQCSATMAPANSGLVSEAQQDGTTTYVYDGNIGDNDLYAITATATTPLSTVCVTTRGYFEKSDAGTRGAAVQLKSGTTTVQSTSTALNTVWGWLWRTDLNDPNTSAAWTAMAVSNAQIGPVVTA